MATIDISNILDNLSSELKLQYSAMREDLVYASGGDGMWDQRAVKLRRGKGRPVLSLPLATPYIDRIAAPIRMNPPSILIKTEDPQLQEITSGVLRGIEMASSAYDAYAEAIRNAATCGLGWIRLAVEEDQAGEACIRIKSVPNPLCIMIDPYSEAIDGSDAKYGIHYGSMQYRSAKELWPDMEFTCGSDIQEAYWSVPDDCVMDVVTYVITPEGCEVTRVVGKQEVTKTTIPGLKSIPLFPVYGERLTTDDKINWGGIIRRVRDVNTSINIVASNVMEMVAAAPRSPWIMSERAVGNHRKTWENQNTEVPAFLLYKDVDGNGQINAPFRADNTVQTQALQGIGDWLKGLMGQTVGMSEAMMGGLEAAQESGKALIARMGASEGAALAMYVDHLTSSITQMARTIINMIPIVYDTPRSILMINQYGKSYRANLNLSEIYTQDVIALLDLEVQSGASMEMQLAEARETLKEIMASAGDKALAFLDLAVESTNLTNKDEISKRVKKILPPELAAGDDQEGAIDPQAKMALDQAMQAQQQMEGTIQYLNGIVTQLQQQLASNKDLIEVEIKKAAIQSETALEKERMITDRTLALETIKQGGNNERLQAQLSAEQQAQIDKMIGEFLKANQSHGHNMNMHALDYAKGTEQAAKLPISISREVAAADHDDEGPEIGGEA